MNNVPPKPGGRFRFNGYICTIKSIEYGDIIFTSTDDWPCFEGYFSMDDYKLDTFPLYKYQFLRSKII